MEQLNKKNNLKEKGISVFEIFLFVISLIAVAYFLGDEFRLVNAAGDTIQTEASSQPLPTEGLTPAHPTSGEIATGAPEEPPTAGSPPPSPETGASTGLTLASVSNFISSSWLSIIVNAGIAFGLYYGVEFGLPVICPECSQSLIDNLALALSLGYGIGAGAGMLIGALSGNAAATLPILGLAGAGWGLIGVGVAFLIFLITYRDEYIAAVQFTCYPWQPEAGGSDCEKCNTGELPCTKYKCQSLGESCELVNEGTKDELCTWVNRNDISPPIISSWDGALDKDNYQYSPDTARSPPDKGVIIKYKNSADGCIPPFARITYGITLTNEAGIPKIGQCRADIQRKDKYSDMTTPGLISQGYYLYSHTLLSVHAADNTEGISLPNGGNFEVYVRCESKNGYSDSGTFVFKYCVQKTPDISPPTIMITNLPNGAPVQSGTTSMPTEVYTDKPADCRWSHNDEDYDTMAGTMQCSQSITEMNAYMLYKCTTTLTGLKEDTDNKFYFNCKSYPLNADADRHKMATNYQYNLIGTRSLVLDSLSPATGELIKDATQNVKVTLKAETSAGYDKGNAKCYFKKTSDSDTNYVLFLNTNSYQHSQDLWLVKGSYDYSVRCCDLGGNCDTKSTQFDVDTDFESPIVARAYNENNQLKIATNENSNCVYDTHSCSYDFDKGIKMTTLDGINHLADWDTDSSFYIKCKDNFGNQPVPDSCSITIRPFKSY